VAVKVPGCPPEAQSGSKAPATADAMGSGAGKQTADGQVVVAAGATVGTASSASPEERPSIPQKPQAPQEGRRPRPGRKSKDKSDSHASEESSGGEALGSAPGASPGASPSGSPGASPPRPARQVNAAQLQRKPPVPQPLSTSVKAKTPGAVALDDDDDEEEEVRPPRKPKQQQVRENSPETVQSGRTVEPEATTAAVQQRPPQSEVVQTQPPQPEVKRDVSVEEFISACREGDQATAWAFLTVKARTAKGLGECEEALFDQYGDSVLHHAVLSGCGKVVEMLLDLGRVQVDIPNARNETALQLACRRGDASLVHTLLQAQADPDRRDAGGLTPFLSAVFAGGSSQVLEQLCKAQANVSAQDARGVGALHFAALRGDATLMDWLLMRKACPDAQTEHSTTPLMLAAKRGHIDGVSLLLGCKANTSLADEAGCTALMHALSSGNSEAAQKLLDAGASVDAVDCAGRSPLFHAVLGAKVEGLKAVIARGGRVNILDEEGRSPLYQACLMSEHVLAKSLLEADADPNLAGRGSTVRPMMRAPESSPEVQDEEDAEEKECCAARACLEEARTCLQVCATLAHNDLLTSVLEYGADINAAPGALGWTSLHLCSAVNNEEGVNLLLARGAMVALEDAEGNTPEALAERAGHDAVLKLLKEAAAAAPEVDPAAASAGAVAPTPSAARRSMALKGSLPPLHAGMTEEAPEEESEPLELYREEWEQRGPDGSLLDRVLSPMVHDALRSDVWRLRWEALTYLSKHFSEVAGSPADVVLAVAQVVASAAKDKMSKVFLASLAVFEELLSDARADVLGTDEFAALLQGKQLDQAEGGSNAKSCGPDALLALLDQTDAGGGSSTASSPQQAAADTLCSCVLHGRVPLDELAFPLLKRIEERLGAELSGKAPKDRKDKALGPKCLAANIKLLARWLSAFGLQQTGIFRRSLVLPLLLRAVSSEHSKVRAPAGDALVQLMALSGGLEDRLWQLLPSKVRKGVQRLAQSQEGVSLLSAVPCEEDAMKKDVIVTEDARAGAFICVSELTPQVWASLQAGEAGAEGGSSGSKSRSSKSKKGSKEHPVSMEDIVAEKLKKALTSKNWKERSEGLASLAQELAAPGGEGVKLLEDGSDAGAGNNGERAGGPLLSQYVLRGHRISTLQALLGSLLGDTVTAVFVGAADLLRLVCGHVPLYIAPLFLEPLLPPLVARLLDTSGKVRGKASETTLEVAALHGCALSEMIAQCVASGSAWSSAPPPTAGGAGGSSSSADRAAGHDRQTGPRLHLLAQLVQQVQAREASGRWTDETWQALADYAVRAAEHKDGNVRKEAAALINGLAAAGGYASAVAEKAVAQLQALAQAKMVQKRPGTTSTRPTTGSTRLGTAAGSRPGTGANFNASGKLSNMGSTGGFTLNMGSTGRLSTASKRSGTSFRPGTSSLRPGTGLNRTREMDEESDNSVHSDAPEVEAMDGTPAGNDGEGVKFFNVQTACPGPDEVISLEEGETALREALPLAEALDEVALDFVAPLIALFGDGWTRCFYSRQWQCRVAALTHLSASMSHRLEEITGPEVSPNALGELLDGAMRAVHEGLGDQNVRVYAEACMAVTAVVPAFCGAVDGRLLVAHLAPLLRQLCARMGDSKEVVRLQTVQALFRLLRPPTGNIVSPIAIAMLILRHVTPPKDEEASGAKGGGPADKGARTGWLCRIGALRDLCKEHTKSMVHQPGATHPGEWLRLKDGLAHGDDLVRYESARLYALVCKIHLKALGDEQAQMPAREAWVAALPLETPPKSMATVRKLLKLPEEFPEGQGQDGELGRSMNRSLNRSGKLGSTATMPPMGPWEVPTSLAIWAGCTPEALEALHSPGPGDEKAVASSLRVLGKAVATFGDTVKKKDGPKPDEAFAGICRAIQQSLSSAVGADRNVFLTAVELCQMSISQLAPVLSGLDINMGLAKTIPMLMERTSLTGTCDVKVGVASDKLVQQLAKHPKVGCEAVTKMVISAIGRTEHPIRPLVLLRTLLSDFGLRLCAKRDVVMLLLGAIGTQLERLSGGGEEAQEDTDSVRPQLVGVLATVNQFSAETVQYAMNEVEPSHRKLIVAALQEAPNPRLVALGATAAEQEEVPHVAGSAVRAASRSREGRGLSPKPSTDDFEGSSPQRGHRGHLAASGRHSRPQLPRAEDTQGFSRSSSMRHVGEASPGGGGIREASPRSSSRRHKRRSSEERSPQASTAASTDCPPNGQSSPSGSPQAPFRNPFGRASTGSLGVGSSMDSAGSSRSVRWCGPEGARPPAPMGLSTRLGGNDAAWRFNGEEAGGSADSRGGGLQRVGSSEGRFMKSKEKKPNDSLNALMDVLSQMETRGKTR